MVPIVPDTESMSFSDIENEIKRLAVRARDGKITVDEMTSGTFTSNGAVLAQLSANYQSSAIWYFGNA